MPALLNVRSPLYLSHTNPPFIYQCIGDQIKIVQVLGNVDLSSPIDHSVNASRTEPIIDQINVKEGELYKEEIIENKATESFVSDNSIDIPINSKDNKCDDTKLTDIADNTSELKQANIEDDFHKETIVKTDNIESNNISKLEGEKLNKDNALEYTSVDTASLNYLESADSDDEASFGTPENSPKSKRRSPKIGKYGKGKAPPPPKTRDDKQIPNEDKNINFENIDSDSKENLPINKTFHFINPIAEKKRRHKSKSPARTKSNNSTMGKLLQIPGKFAFWHKNDDKTKPDNISLSSDDHSRRSSIIERNADDFQSCTDLNALIENESTNNKLQFEDIENIIVIEKCDDQISFKDAISLEGETVTQNIQEKSDELQKLINAKLQTHPEYKTVALHSEEIPTTSKSTDV